MNDAPAARWPVAIFDLDGTLADTVNLIVESYQHAFRTVIGRRRTPTSSVPGSAAR